MAASALRAGAVAACLGVAPAGALAQAGDGQGRPPNIILVLTDDQGYSDVGFNGNPIVKTPHLDALAAEARVFDRMYAAPVCSPTRAALLTGRYSYRTGVLDTAGGVSKMHPDEVTIAEVLREKGYATAIVGKWHLGDSPPLRPIDQGFDQSLTHAGGLIGQDNTNEATPSYFDPPLLENGVPVTREGYCEHVYADAALAFIEENAGRPFFLYYATNLPHHPLTVAEASTRPYLEAGLSEETARFYGMISEVDSSVGAMVGKLEEVGQSGNTVIIFLGDNGTSSLMREDDRHQSGLRGTKTNVHENGIRVPAFIHMPGAIEAGRSDQVAAVQDILPTLCDAVAAPLPQDRTIDGVSLWPHLTQGEPLAPRTIFVQWHRGSTPEPFHNFAAITPTFKLLEGRMRAESISREESALELYDISEDPNEARDLAIERRDVVERLRKEYVQWFEEMKSERNWQPPAIHIGHEGVNEVLLTWQDRMPGEDEAPRAATWSVDVQAPGEYRFIVELSAMTPLREVWETSLFIGGTVHTKTAQMEEYEVHHERVALPPGPMKIAAVVTDEEGTAMPARRIIVQGPLP